MSEVEEPASGEEPIHRGRPKDEDRSNRGPSSGLNAEAGAVTVPVNAAGNYFSMLQAVAMDRSIDEESRLKLIAMLKGTNPTSDRLTYRLAITLIGIIALVSIVAIWSLLYMSQGIDVPEGLVAIASGAVGGLAGLLSPSRAPDSRT